jgi:hypothetical protein
MASYSHHYHHRPFLRVGVNPTLCKCANHATTIWLRLENLSNCFTCPFHTYMRCLSIFAGCGWAYVFTLTPLTPQTFPQICEMGLKSYLMKVCKPCHYSLIEAGEPFKMHPMSMSYIYEVFEHLLRLQMVIKYHIHIDTTTDLSLDL